VQGVHKPTVTAQWEIAEGKVARAADESMMVAEPGPLLDEGPSTGQLA
jgi:hypothetical protein